MTLRNQLIDRRGFIQRVIAAGTGLIVPTMPIIPAFAQNCQSSSPYVVRPPWKVAGVDYCVGIGRNIVLKDARTATPANMPGTGGFEPNGPGAGLIFIEPTDGTSVVTIDGWHFHNITLTDRGSTNLLRVVVRNCLFEWDEQFFNNFDCTGPQLIRGRCKELVVEHCEFGAMVSSEGTIDWAAGENATRDLDDYASSKFTMRWNFFNNCLGDGANQKSGGDTIINYNVFLNQAGTGAQGHADQFTLEQGGGRHFYNTQMSFNTIFDDTFFECGNGSQGFTFQGNDHCEERIITEGGTVDHNTWINVTTGCPGDILAGVFYGPCVDISDTKSGKQWKIENNYVDDVGFTRVGTTNLEWLRVQNFFHTPLGGTCLSQNNIDLRTNTKPTRYNRGLQTPANLASDNQPDSC